MTEHKYIIRALMDRGITQTEIGVRVGKSQAWVSAVLAGEYKDIKWREGVLLRELAAELIHGTEGKEAA